MRELLIADLYCGAGGAAWGIHLACEKAGVPHRIVGFDIRPMPRYPFEFIQQDALNVDLAPFDAVWASPPCQWTTLAAIQWRQAGRRYPELVDPTRRLLLIMDRPYVLEQPTARPLRNPVKLNGACFQMRVRRTRYFETNWPVNQPLLPPEERAARIDRPWDARKGGPFYPVGHFSGVALARELMGIDWMKREELTQAIPPAYAEYIWGQLLRHMGHYPNCPVDSEVA